MEWLFVIGGLLLFIVFKWGKSTLSKSEAAVVVQNLLEVQQRAFLFDDDPASFANKLITVAWERKPDIFNGQFGQLPYKISVAAFALAVGIQDREPNNVNMRALITSLGNIFQEVQQNGRLYPLNGTDEYLLEYSLKVFEEITEEIAETPDKLQEEINSVLGL